jgi:hypothetical protein
VCACVRVWGRRGGGGQYLMPQLVHASIAPIAHLAFVSRDLRSRHKLIREKLLNVPFKWLAVELLSQLKAR